MKRVLVLSFSPIASDPRVMRQLHALQGRYALTVAGFGPAPDGPFDFHALAGARLGLPAKLLHSGLRLLGATDASYWRLPAVRAARADLAGRRFDAVVANDLAALPVALKLAGDAPVLLDAHEYTPREFEDRWAWRLVQGRYYLALCRRYLQRVAAMTTVCEGIAQEYRQFGVAPKVVLNCPWAQQLPVRPVDPRRIRLVHHGISIPSRRLELMLDLMALLPPHFSLDLMLVDAAPAYTRKLRERASADPRIRFRDPVRMEEIAASINEYDMGLFLLPPVNFNYRMALPNKFFEFIQARLAVAIGPSPEMARLVDRYGLGVVADDFTPRALAQRLAALAPADIEAMKRRSDAASSELNADHAGRVLLAEIERLAG